MSAKGFVVPIEGKCGTWRPADRLRSSCKAGRPLRV